MKHSAGILVYRHTNNSLEVLLAHPAGPFWGKKDTWTIPKGEANEDEDLTRTAKREYEEETGLPPPDGELQDLGQTKQGSKTNYIWAIEGDFDISQFKCTSTFEMEWPPKSGTRQSFPENDRVAWFSYNEAIIKLFKAQTVFIERLTAKLNIQLDAPSTEPTQLPKQGTLF